MIYIELMYCSLWIDDLKKYLI